ncbi:hypothetical protein L6452_43308 [Arctium lappa]|uniref:Uncharacterized protein n=1 Tax=Arctium lappa TaxID=4217 RepID=A0ACB8XKL7_ARCLA|nr:hypothetical protein L6452_43308 [Arctium lappa]
MAFCLLLSSSFAQILPSSSSSSSGISAAPALLPIIQPSSPPLSSPSPAASSPDITPLFPSPGGTHLSPAESSLPTIPSSPSPPNPDDMPSYGPNTMAISPTASLPAASSSSTSVSWNSATSMVVVMVVWAFQLFIHLKATTVSSGHCDGHFGHFRVEIEGHLSSKPSSSDHLKTSESEASASEPLQNQKLLNKTLRFLNFTDQKTSESEASASEPLQNQKLLNKTLRFLNFTWNIQKLNFPKHFGPHSGLRGRDLLSPAP